MKPILGIDSETVNDAEGRARCTLIACSDGSNIARPGGITTDEALRYIVARKGELWTFFGDYDVNFWLRDMPQSRLDRLRRKGWATWGTWRVHHIPRRLFEVWELRYGDAARYAKIYDVFPFVQSSFVHWLESWSLCDSRTLARIAAMKARRAEFSSLSAAKILAYTQDEVRLIAAGVEQLKLRIHAAGCTPSQWLGPGAVAAHVMRRHKVKDHMPRKTHPWADRAYFGGRIETAAVGIVRGPLYYYDIVSAYPAACVDLPCFRHGKWVRTKEPHGAALCHVTWEPRRNAIPTWGPFPVRIRDGAPLRYYAHGKGVYWWEEIQPWMKSEHYRLSLGSCWEWRQDCSHRPLSWVGDLFHERRILKRSGDPAEYALKLVLNSIYGKFAQRVGTAPYYCPEWAGMITARTRARISNVLATYADRAILIATDGILLRTEIPISDGGGLGSWTLEGRYRWADLWQPGFYILSDGKLRTRGYSRVDVDAKDLRRHWRRDGMQAEVPISKEFIVGYRLATARGTMEDFCRWTKAETTLSLNPLPRRFPANAKVRGHDAYWTQAPHSAAFERDLRVPVLERDRIGAYEEDGCSEGFARD